MSDDRPKIEVCVTCRLPEDLCYCEKVCAYCNAPMQWNKARTRLECSGAHIHQNHQKTAPNINSLYDADDPCCSERAIHDNEEDWWDVV